VKIRQVGDEFFHADGWVGGQTDMTKLTGRTSQFCEPPPPQKKAENVIINSQVFKNGAQATGNRK